eukprot:TRINITY_DN1526_c0_g1_i1.p2 TRINITY_DN1526_c0_g1~~TRINITY_DN1526_c0_g1_i1.p2  ORF type:complete len:119 (+),score=26.82 TRINITY_DN1526_c0_g1_i1:320-676(+)
MQLRVALHPEKQQTNQATGHLLQTTPAPIPSQSNPQEQQQEQFYQQTGCWGQQCIAMKTEPAASQGLHAGTQWVITEAPSEWSPQHTDELRDWFFGSVPQLSELDNYLKTLNQEAYED